MAGKRILVDRVARKAPVTLLYSAREEEHNQALALRRVLEDSLKR